MKPYGNLSVFEDDKRQDEGASDHQPSALLFENRQSHQGMDSEETLQVILNLVKELSNKVHQSARFFDIERIERELFSRNEQILKNLIQAQTTAVVDRIIAGLAHKIADGLSGSLIQVLNNEKKSSDLLMNALNHRFRGLDERYEKLERFIVSHMQKVEMRLERASFELEKSVRLEGDPGASIQYASFKERSAYAAALREASHRGTIGRSSQARYAPSLGILSRIGSWIAGPLLSLFKNPAMFLLIFVMGLFGFHLSSRLRGPKLSPAAQMAAAEDVRMHNNGEEMLPLAVSNQEIEAPIREESKGAPTPREGIPQNMKALESLLPRTRELASLREAALLGDHLALYEMGVRFLSGTGVPRSPETATQLFQKAVEHHSPFAAYQLASQYEKGIGVSRNLSQSLMLYEKAAMAGHVKAMHNLAVILASGEITGKPDYDKAMVWFQKAADHGLKDSQYNLGLLLAHGLGGSQDRVEAYKWFELAGQQDDAESLRKRDMVSKKMSSTDVALARVRASQWRPKTSEVMDFEGLSVLPWSQKKPQSPRP
jgi:hypothetical protein